MSADVIPGPIQLLHDAAWRVEDARGHAIAAGSAITLRSSDATFAYIARGAATAHAAAEPTGIPLVDGDLVVAPAGTMRLRAATETKAVTATAGAVRGAAGLVGLPPTIVVRGFAGLEPAIARLAEELGCGDDGAVHEEPVDGVVCAHMATTVLAAALRAWTRCDVASRGWRGRMSDPFLARVVEAIHADLGRAWTVAELAALAAMGRSSFAERFHAAMGMAPLQYVTRVRIAAAKQHLEHDGMSVAAAARTLGYGSEDGFSRAFRRATGQPPSIWLAARRDLVAA